jgi:hypothetical protein
MPPDRKPEGDNVVWIPGYWMWDSDREDFLWVSGFWRIPPPDHQWVPGVWQEVEGGSQWTPGYWAVAGQEEVQFVPAPPPTVDEGPSTPAPDDNSTYVPGCWVYRGTRFLWRPGFWVPFQPGWLWAPAHYVWSPAGCVFVEGYWDRPLETRGLLFAPVQFAPALLSDRNFTYVPQYIVQPDFLLTALFVHPATCHYFFGDYFDARYQQRGFIPWVDYRVSRSIYDPQFNYYRHLFARDESWERGLRELYVGRFRGDVRRPPRTLAQQLQMVRSQTANNSGNVSINNSALVAVTQVNNIRVTRLANVSGNEVRNAAVSPQAVKLQEVPRERRVQEQKAATQFHAVARQRQEVQSKLLQEGKAPVRVTDQPRQSRIQLPPARGGVNVQKQPDVRTAPGPHAPPPAPRPPAHQEREIPRHEPPRPSLAPRSPAPPPRQEQPRPMPMPPHQGNPPAPAPKPPAPPPHEANPPAPAPKPPAPAPKPQPPAPPPPHQANPPAPAPKPPAPPPPHHEAPKPPSPPPAPPHHEAPKPPAHPDSHKGK